MLAEVTPRLWVGNLSACPIFGDDAGGRTWAGVIHACKSPCHQQVLGYTGSLPKSHPAYLSAEAPGGHLLLNLIDPPIPLFQAASFLVALDFLDRHMGQGDVCCHCNQGQSRAPVIAALWLAKRKKVIPGETWFDARAAMRRLYPAFAPGKGIELFMAGNWGAIQ